MPVSYECTARPFSAADKHTVDELADHLVRFRRFPGTIQYALQMLGVLGVRGAVKRQALDQTGAIDLGMKLKGPERSARNAERVGTFVGIGQQLAAGRDSGCPLPVDRNGEKLIRHIAKQRVRASKRRQPDGDGAYLKIPFVADDVPSKRQHGELEAETGREYRKLSVSAMACQFDAGSDERVASRRQHAGLACPADKECVVTIRDVGREVGAIEGVEPADLRSLEPAVVAETRMFLRADPRLGADLQQQYAEIGASPRWCGQARRVHASTIEGSLTEDRYQALTRNFLSSGSILAFWLANECPDDLG